jgi:hypothetical protein
MVMPAVLSDLNRVPEGKWTLVMPSVLGDLNRVPEGKWTLVIPAVLGDLNRVPEGKWTLVMLAVLGDLNRDPANRPIADKETQVILNWLFRNMLSLTRTKWLTSNICANTKNAYPILVLMQYKVDLILLKLTTIMFLRCETSWLRCYTYCALAE